MRTSITSVAALPFMSLILLACFFDPEPGPVKRLPNEWAKQTAPESVLVNLERAYLKRDHARYDSLLYDAEWGVDTLSTESFTFEFSDADVRQGEVPPSWGRDDEMASAISMLTADRVTRIQIRLTYGPSFYDNAVGHEGQKIINVTDVYLAVDDKPPGGTTTDTYLVQGQRADFRFKVQWVDTQGDSLWRIIHWKDRGDGTGKSAPAF